MRIAIAGLGTVGSSVVNLLREQKELLTQRAGQSLTVVAVAARDPAKKRGCDTSGLAWAEKPQDLALRDDVDVIVELMGGAEGTPLELARAAIDQGKHLVTANKAMIAAHGAELALAAEEAKLALAFEAAVCGGIPVLKALREGLAANQIIALRGILNGTCNYILTEMAEKGQDFADALADAQAKGYAEADPSADIDGFDAANKLAILSALAFGAKPDLDGIYVEGIRSLTRDQLREAADQGGCIKLLGIAERKEDGIVQRVQPVFVPRGEALANVNGVLNAVEIVTDYAGTQTLSGPGAGGDATASAVVANLVDIARGHIGPAFGLAAQRLG